MIAIYDLYVEIDLETLECNIRGNETMFQDEYIALANELMNEYLDNVIEKKNV